MMNNHLESDTLKASPSRSGLRALVVAPFVGEFGWELMNWQARVRWVVERCGAPRVIVTGDPGKQRLYDGPRVEHVEIDLSDLPGQASDDRRIDGESKPLARARIRREMWRRMRTKLAELDLCSPTDAALPREVGLLSPAYSGRMWPTSGDAQSFVSLRAVRAEMPEQTDVVLVPRRRDHAPQRSRPEEWWQALREKLIRGGLRVELSPNTLDAAIDAFSRARLAAGGSTGGLHLASLCECPHFVWGDDESQRWTDWNISNRQRYETIWNPLGTPVVYEPLGWQPEVDRVAAGIENALRRVGRGLNYQHKLSTFRRVWSLRRRAARLWIGDAATAMPWRMRRWVAEKVL